MIKKELVIICLIFCLALIARIYLISQGTTFHYDMSRDAYRVNEIVQKHQLKLLGPETDIPGVHHGVGYYYLLTLPYFFSANPVLAAMFIAWVSAAGSVVCYLTAKTIFSSKKTGLLAAFFYAISYEFIQYGVWLSNPSLAPIIELIILYGVWQWLKGKEYGFLLAIVGVALSMHFQLFLAYQFFSLMVLYAIFRPKISYKYLISGLLISSVLLLPFIIAELKFSFSATKSVLSFLTSHSGQWRSLQNVLAVFTQTFYRVIENITLPGYYTLSAALFWFSIIAGLFMLRSKAKAIGFLLTWFFTAIPLFFFFSGALTTEFSLVGVVVIPLLLLAAVIGQIQKISALKLPLLLFLMIAVSLSNKKTIINASNGADLFSIQKGMTFQRQQKIVDYTYREAAGKPFSICTLTVPLFVNTTWAYVYEFYGKKTYGYIPDWLGMDQVGRLGQLPISTPSPSLRFLIIEPEQGMPYDARKRFMTLENDVSELLATERFGEFIVQKRIRKPVNEVKQINDLSSIDRYYLCRT